ncbi:intraflagellar transport protein 25 homolog isoform X2 [Hemitrygon akajei]|uniref:intraflagellar transport protein 25 homolog isoform X2 n=1 Tax=Hemitrygon akajei TaxID=2704970 RepID=UPI003BF9B519
MQRLVQRISQGQAATTTPSVNRGPEPSVCCRDGRADYWKGPEVHGCCGNGERAMRQDFGVADAGTKLVLATSGDEKHPPENIIDGNTETFWITTGMFPQEFIIRFPEVVQINCVKIHCYNVRRLSIEKNSEKDPVDFEPLAKSELEHAEEQLQLEEFALDGTRATHLRFVIKSAFDHFVSVHKVTVEGTEEVT